MRFKDVFSIIGPAMVGPSSSHTAGAVRLGRIARSLLDAEPQWAEIGLFGSFADTYRGHGTDLALIGGLLGYDPDDARLVRSAEEARQAGLQVTIAPSHGLAAHPNTAEIRLGAADSVITVRGASIGGGNVEIERVNEFDVRFTGSYPTLLVFHADRKGMIAEITGLLSGSGINIGSMDVDRAGRNGNALTVIESDLVVPASLLSSIAALPDVQTVRMIDIMEGMR
ncbi:L-serine ammonia-lyase, iron-sulfur-dependent subunit beta [Paenibacillus allorhizosphaerae]|uniref:L-serine deaminase n=1 Tax=Paenibacillus allorhizosphaerae TaxID=2849866 RepID=A0ABM8VBC0_9BACL|nr:L-serine ammonia-lyase, iron-sulfur-dependent subunit beta [Paenibacillus allorhizosphaerae]CAG7618970.1 L-serine dehydratase, beta chain [Paenibacillus allorhizosphaerae]